MQSSLEILLLSFVQQGLRTPYELKTRAGISLGSAVPALARLQRAGLLRSSEPGARGSRTYEITSAGARTLQNGWGKVLDSSASDPDSVLRAAYLAWRHGSASQARTVLEAAASNAAGLAKVAQAEAERFGAMMTRVNSEAYRQLRARLDSARLKAQVEAFETLARELVATKEAHLSSTRRKAGRRKPPK